jgi:hypothetical protein
MMVSLLAFCGKLWLALRIVWRPIMRRLVPLLFAPLLLGAQAGPSITIAETGQRFDRLQEALNTIGSGRGTIVFGPGTYRDCGVHWQGRVTFRAEEPGTAIFERVVCEGKGALVLRSPLGASVEGLIFQTMRSSDRNGAGIRLESGDLNVSNSVFRDSQQGILTSADPDGDIVIDRSTFSGLGGCPDGQCSHSIYAGQYRSLTVTRSRFERGTGGHYLKSRALSVNVADNTFDDTRGTQTNYMIDLSIGSIGRIVGNYFVQGQDKDNYSAFITIGPEGQENPSGGLTITDNRALLAPGVQRVTTFIADWAQERLIQARNTLGQGIRAYEQR